MQAAAHVEVPSLEKVPRDRAGAGVHDPAVPGRQLGLDLWPQVTELGRECRVVVGGAL
jgi:hypothetical protein